MRTPFAALDPARCEALATQAGLELGGKFHFFETTGSTNDLALAAARAGAASGSVFVADSQSRGRGRHGRDWSAEPRSALLVSLLVRPRAPLAGTTPWLTLAVGLGLRACLQRHLTRRLGLKWPNDVLVEGRKVAGILCEAVLVGAELRACVIGIGVNVWAAPEGSHLRRPATSLSAEGARLSAEGASGLSREALLVEVLQATEARVEAFANGTGQEAVRAACASEFSAYDVLFGQRVGAEGDPAVVGTAQGIDANCNLRILTQEGMRFVGSGDIQTLGAPSPPV